MQKGWPKSEEKNNFWGRLVWVPNAYEYEFIIIPKLCISDDTSLAFWHHVRPIIYPTHCPSHSSGGRCVGLPVSSPRLYEETLRRSIYYRPPDGDGLRSGSDLSQLKSVSAIKNFMKVFTAKNTVRPKHARCVPWLAR